MSPTKCTCVYATAENTAAVRQGFEAGGYLKHKCAACIAQEAETTAKRREMKPCPWCGEMPGEYRHQERSRGKRGAVECSCGVAGPEVRANYKPISTWADAADAAWNDRYKEPTNEQ